MSYARPCYLRDPGDRCEVCRARARGESIAGRPWTGPIPSGGPGELARFGLLEEAPAGYWERWAERSAERIRLGLTDV